MRLKTPEPEEPEGAGEVFRLADFGLFSTCDYAGWPAEALESRERAGFPIRCEPDKPICVSRGAVCRLCGARDEAW